MSTSYTSYSPSYDLSSNLYRYCNVIFEENSENIELNNTLIFFIKDYVDYWHIVNPNLKTNDIAMACGLVYARFMKENNLDYCCNVSDGIREIINTNV
jgi:hypothetical protein